MKWNQLSKHLHMFKLQTVTFWWVHLLPKEAHKSLTSLFYSRLHSKQSQEELIPVQSSRRTKQREKMRAAPHHSVSLWWQTEGRLQGFLFLILLRLSVHCSSLKSGSVPPQRPPERRQVVLSEWSNVYCRNVTQICRKTYIHTSVVLPFFIFWHRLF